MSRIIPTLSRLGDTIERNAKAAEYLIEGELYPSKEI